ncbi:hypothetical protein U9M48_000387 [Paspalum notatum var. saurae]|uniref:DUF4220 domain-containing protein n=1 Tax=Paspalum notatum var. saurae TaxID=547442 RepID=A0AAQ3PF69_PASNO
MDRWRQGCSSGSREDRLRYSSNGGGSCVEEVRLLAGVRDLWNVWEIHCLILLSLFLQVLLLLTAGMRRRSASSVLRTVLWLAYLSADSVAIFVLGHLAAHASGPRHQLMFFWAPFVLVHLGGQDTITAFSKQDNELWRRHLLSLVFHIAFAGYVAAKASWPDSRLRAAMVLMFLCGCFKYAERTYCLYCASPSILVSRSVRSLSHTLRVLQRDPRNGGIAEPRYHWTAGFYNWEKRPSRDGARNQMEETFDMMLNGRRSWQSIRGRGITGSDITSVDALHNTVPSILLADDELPDMLGKFLSNEGRHRAYEYVGVRLAHCYQRLYTKNPLREAFYIVATDLVHRLRFTHILIDDGDASPFRFLAETCLDTLFLLCSLFSYVSTPVALVLFMAAEKGDELHTSRADITVSYILLVGAIALDMSSATISIFSNVSSISLPAGALLRCIQPAWSSKQWSEEIAQYSMIRRHATQDTAGMASSVRQWISKRLDRCSACHGGGGGVGFFDLTCAPVTRGHTPILEFILDQLLSFGTEKHWGIASSRGQLSLGRWMSNHPVPADSELYKTTDSHADFPMSVLIWHIATDICYYYLGDSSTSSDDRLNKRKMMSRELSNYIMYLVFKCGVMLTSQSQFVHEQVHCEIRDVLAADHRRPHQQVNLGEKEAVMTLFKAIRKEAHQQDSENKTEMQKHEEESADDDNDKRLKITRESIYSPVLPRACEVAHELININDENHRWELIASLWSEMLYYTAPRCGGAFHYKHLSTGGEFITHVLFLMYSLGPFMPSPAGA